MVIVAKLEEKERGRWGRKRVERLDGAAS